MTDQVAKDALTSLVQGLTSEEVADLVKNSNQDNFFMYVFIIFALIMIVGMVTMVWIFIKKDTKKDLRQNEQYKNLLDTQSSQYKDLLDGYTKMIDQNASTNTEFRQTIADIGNILRELSNTISKGEAKSDAETDKFELLFQRFDSMKAEISKSNASLHQAFREHDYNSFTTMSGVQASVDNLKEELKRNTDWCQRSKEVK